MVFLLMQKRNNSMTQGKWNMMEIRVVGWEDLMLMLVIFFRCSLAVVWEVWEVWVVWVEWAGWVVVDFLLGAGTVTHFRSDSNDRYIIVYISYLCTYLNNINNDNNITPTIKSNQILISASVF